MMRGKKIALSVLIVAASVVLDRLVKYWAVNVLLPRGNMQFIPGIIGFSYAENTGASFSMFSGKRWFLVAVTTAAIVFMAWYLASGKVTHRIGQVGFLLVIGGAIGNYIDRIFYGYVVDMFELLFMNFAIFNVADLFVTAGGIMCAIYFLFYDEDFKIGKSKCG